MLSGTYKQWPISHVKILAACTRDTSALMNAPTTASLSCPPPLDRIMRCDFMIAVVYYKVLTVASGALFGSHDRAGDSFAVLTIGVSTLRCLTVARSTRC